MKGGHGVVAISELVIIFGSYHIPGILKLMNGHGEIDVLI